MVMDSAMFYDYHQRILEFARTHRLPTVCGVRGYAEAGCLMAYAPDVFEMFRRAAIFVDKILKGAKPGELPVEQPAKVAGIVARIANPTGMRVNSLLVEVEQILAATDVKQLAQAASAAGKLQEILKKLNALKGGDGRVARAREYVAQQINRIKLASIEAL